MTYYVCTIYATEVGGNYYIIFVFLILSGTLHLNLKIPRSIKKNAMQLHHILKLCHSLADAILIYNI